MKENGAGGGIFSYRLRLCHADGADDADFTNIDLFGLGISQIWGNLQITCRFLSFFLVVSRKKRIFVAKLNV